MKHVIETNSIRMLLSTLDVPGTGKEFMELELINKHSDEKPDFVNIWMRFDLGELGQLIHTLQGLYDQMHTKAMMRATAEANMRFSEKLVETPPRVGEDS